MGVRIASSPAEAGRFAARIEEGKRISGTLAVQPDLQIGVDTRVTHRDHTRRIEPGSTVIFYTDGVAEHPRLPIDQFMARLADHVSTHADLSLRELICTLADHDPGASHDDMARLAIRNPPPGAPHWNRPTGRNFHNAKQQLYKNGLKTSKLPGYPARQQLPPPRRYVIGPARSGDRSAKRLLLEHL